MIDTKGNWHKCDTEVFWGEIAPCDHVVQIYDTDEILLGSLSGYAESGITAGESVILIATQPHLDSLAERLIAKGYNLNSLCAANSYIPVNAEDALSMFMVNGWPDEERFVYLVKGLISLARGEKGRKVRAYGEMVALLWEQGNNGATVHLEHLWNLFCAREVFSLFCAYPKSGFTQDVRISVNEICCTHGKIISGQHRSESAVYYKRVNENAA